MRQEAFFILFSDEENSSTNFNELVVLNALDFSFDLDVDPSADQALTFNWFCKKSDEVWFSFVSYAHYVLPQLGMSVLRRKLCRCEGRVGVVTDGDISKIMTPHTTCFFSVKGSQSF